MEIPQSLVFRELGLCEYMPVWRAMQAFTDGRDADTPDELWFLEHSPVFTQGQAGRPEHILNPGEIPVVQVDRGGQVTYHGPGQLVGYLLVDLERRRIGVRDLVDVIEQGIVGLLADFDIVAKPRPDAPGVYVDGAKIASLGLRVRRGRSYHGLALNVDMDLEPFRRINPCGYAGQAMTRMRDLGVDAGVAEVAAGLRERLTGLLGYNSVTFSRGLPLDEQPV